MTNKTANYSAELTAALKAGYAACDSDESRKAFVEAFAAEHGKKAASVRAKLVREGVYQKAETPRKRSMQKAEIVEKIAKAIDCDSEILGSLEKATTKALRLVLIALPKSSAEDFPEDNQPDPEDVTA